MKSVLIAAVASGVMAVAAHAEDYRPPARSEVPRCAGAADLLHRTAYGPEGSPNCCSGEIRCTQFLSTSVIRLPHGDKHI